MKAVIIVVAAGLGVAFLSCATQCFAASPEASHPQLDGKFANYLSRQGVSEIAAMPNNHPMIRWPVFHIMMTARDKAEVSSGRKPKRVGDLYTTFKVRKNAGHWQIVDGSVHDTELVQSYSWTR